MSDWKPWRDLCASINARTMPSYLFTQEYGEAPKGPNGRRLCKWCGIEVPKGRRTTCSEECQLEIEIRRSPGLARYHVQKRDHDVCARCGIDTNDVIDEAISMARGHHNPVYAQSTTYRRFIHENNLHRYHAWEAHHTHAIAEGGHLCGLEGYETLCIWCHQRETRQLAGRRKRKRTGQMQLIGDDACPGQSNEEEPCKLNERN